MAIVFQRAEAAVGQSVTIDIGAAGNDRLLVCQYGDESIATDDAAMGGTPSVDGKNFTLRLAKTNPDGIGNAQEFWVHDEASLGSSNGSLSVSGGGVDASSGIRVALWYGVDDGLPTDTAFDDTTIGSGPSANIDVPANGLIVAGAGNGSTGGTASWTSPLVERIDGGLTPPASAILGLAEAVETSAQTNKAYTVVVGDGTLRSTLLLMAFAEAGAAEPTITDVDTDEDIDDLQTGVVITGTLFEATQGTGKVEISDNATYGSGNIVLQDETAWGDTSITITVAIGAMSPDPVRYVWVTNNAGDRNTVGFQVRLRRAQAFRMIASPNIAASGEVTTQRLVTPSGKVGGDFFAGRIQDDENPADSIDAGLDDFYEDEWCMEATLDSNAVQYQFRVLVGSGVPATLSVDPRWTVTDAVPFVDQGTLGSLPVSGFAGEFQASLVIQGTLGNVTVTGFAGTADHGQVLQGTAGALPVSGFISALNLGVEIQGTAGTVTVTGFAGEFQASLIIQGTLGNVTVTGFAGAAQHGQVLQGTLATVTVTGFAGGITEGDLVQGTLGALTVTGLAGAIEAGQVLQGTEGHLSISGFAGTVDLGALPFVEQGTLGNLALTGFGGVFCNDIFAPDGITGITGVVGDLSDVTADDANWLEAV